MKNSGSVSRAEMVARIKARQKAMVEQAVKELMALESKRHKPGKES